MFKNIIQLVAGLALLFAVACSQLETINEDGAAEDLNQDTSSDFAEENNENKKADATTDEIEDFGDESTEDKSADSAKVKNDFVSEPNANGAEAENKINAINYLSNSNGGTIEIKTQSPASYSVRTNENTNQYVIEIKNATLSSTMKRPLIMKDFDGAFGAINTYVNPNGQTSRIVVQMKSAMEPVITQVGNTLLVVPGNSTHTQPQLANSKNTSENPNNDELGSDTQSNSHDLTATNAASSSDEEFKKKSAQERDRILSAQTLSEFLTGRGKFYGKPISIQTKDADVRDIISFIAEESGVNLVISDDVTGKVSVKLRQIPWDQALVIILRSRSLGYIRQGNVLRITTLSALQAETNAAKEVVDAQKRLTPLKVQVIPVSYATVGDLEKQIKPFLSEGRGQLVSDSRTSSLIVTDTEDVLARVERLVKELDIPPAQVMIESKIVEASETFTRRLGINWSLTNGSKIVSNNGGVNGSALTMSPSMGSTSIAPDQITAQSSFLRLQLGTLDFLGNLDATLSLAQADSLVKIISSPRVVTVNKEKSEISQKSEVITIQTIVDAQNVRTTKVDRTPVELKLEVTPQITAEGSVLLEVNILRQFAGAEVDGSSHARPINSRAAKTKVLVPSGQTAVIGGIYQSDETESENGVPGLKEIPVLGWLFKQKFRERLKNELLLFLTPRILNAKDQSVID
ncbi:MAG: type IV pilus secretin PilQ [Bdellovibrionales bacterium]